MIDPTDLYLALRNADWRRPNNIFISKTDGGHLARRWIVPRGFVTNGASFPRSRMLNDMEEKIWQLHLHLAKACGWDIGDFEKDLEANHDKQRDRS